MNDKAGTVFHYFREILVFLILLLVILSTTSFAHFSHVESALKIQVTQTLLNGQFLLQVLTKQGAEALKILVQPGAKLSFNVEGAKAGECVDTKAKTGTTKKIGNNLVLESEGEQRVEVTDIYTTEWAYVGDVGWNYTASDASVTTSTPEAQALAADAAMAEPGALLPVIAPGWMLAGVGAVAALANDGGSALATLFSVIRGVITAGPVVVTLSLTIAFFKKTGTAILQIFQSEICHFNDISAVKFINKAVF